jgi:glycosyltransferase involved in cell wall biosynthesis
MQIEEAVSGICVTYNTKDLIERTYTSIRKFHFNMRIIIVDGSEEKNSCFEYVKELTKDPNTQVFHVNKNIGHGRGLHIGIENTETKFALIFDSDIEMLKSPVQAMLDMMEEDTYGIGYIEKTAFDGHEWGSKAVHKTQGWMRYLHPYFCLINLDEYDKYKPFIHHGAPAVNTMLDIHRRGLGNKIIKEFPGLGHSSGQGVNWKGETREYIRHDTYGTRAYRRSKGLEEIEGVWERVDNIEKGNGITCITCTGDRPLALSLCQRWLKNQTLVPNQWIIVDDGKIPAKNLDFIGLNYVYRRVKPNEPKHTMLLNLKEAFEWVKGDKIFFFEDDEYYAPNYIEEMSSRLDNYEVVGIGRSKYYYLPLTKYGVHSNMGHASLAQTAFKRSFFNEIKDILFGDNYFDIRIWKLVNGTNASFESKVTSISESISSDGKGLIFDDKNSSLYVGMKGMPGRAGIGSGHNGNMSWYALDTNKSVLKKWISKEEDFKIYSHLLDDTKNFKAEKGRLIPSK